MMLDNYFAFPMGIIIAMVSSTVGIGGGILWMPFLLIIMQLNPSIAVVTSLMIQTAGMGSGTLGYLRQRQIDFRLAMLLSARTVPGIALGAMLTRLVTPTHLELILGILTLLTAVIFVSSNHDYADSGLERVSLKDVGRYGWVVALLSITSGMLSISIGEWLIPLMRQKMNLRMTTAVATSVTTVFGTCILGSLAHFFLGGTVNSSILVWAIPGVLIGGQIGPRIAERVNDRLLKELFIFLLTLIGIHLMYNSY